ncbi:MAG: hypothetical protein A2163_00695 [Actinobacteria bacterium RBG_13_35_12]|nr:MAG: hypothetical protein A2163_00695 [Actinobacteria bacterium RBG_13_35_12]
MGCKRCGSVDLAEKKVIFKNNTEHLEIRCNACKKVQGYKKQTSGDDDNFIMPFGKYRGKTIKEIIALDIGYARWGIENLKNNISTRFKEILSKNNL